MAIIFNTYDRYAYPYRYNNMYIYSYIYEWLNVVGVKIVNADIIELTRHFWNYPYWIIGIGFLKMNVYPSRINGRGNSQL